MNAITTIFFGLIVVAMLAACGTPSTEMKGAEETGGDTPATQTATANSDETKSTDTLAINTDVYTPTGNPTTCIEHYDPTVDYFPDKVSANYAELWEVSYANNYKVLKTEITVASSHAGAIAQVRPETYVLLQCGTPAPALEGELQGATVIEIPIRTAVDGDDVLFDVFELFDMAEGFIGFGETSITEAEAPYLPRIYEQIQSGRAIMIGYEPNLEALADLAPDAYFKSSGEEQLFEQIDNFDVPVVLYNPNQEGPLGTAEKVKFFALFINAERQAIERFDTVETNYLDLRDKAQSQPSQPRVLIGSSKTGSDFNTRQNDRYEAVLIRDAGGKRVLDLPGNSFATVSLETVIEEGANADFWFHMAWFPKEQTAQDFIAADPRIEPIRAMKEGNTFHRFGPRQLDYFYHGAIQPDVMLADIVSILYPELLPDHELVFLQRIPAE